MKLCFLYKIIKSHRLLPSELCILSILKLKCLELGPISQDVGSLSLSLSLSVCVFVYECFYVCVCVCVFVSLCLCVYACVPVFVFS